MGIDMRKEEVVAPRARASGLFRGMSANIGSELGAFTNLQSRASGKLRVVPSEAPTHRCDSVLSIAELGEADLDDSEPKIEIRMSSHGRLAEKVALIDTGDVTLQDIRDRVWAWVDENKKTDPERVTQFRTDSFQARPQTQVKMRRTPGEKMKRKIIKGHSTIENERKSFRQMLDEKVDNPDKERIRAAIGVCYSGLRYQQYLERKALDVPPFLTGVDFSFVIQQRKLERKAIKAQSRNQSAAMELDSSFG
jgi:hypothetical protein